MTSSRSRSKTVRCNAKIYRGKADQRSLTTSVYNCPCMSIAGTYVYFFDDRSLFNRYNRSLFAKTQRICHWSHTSPARNLNKSSTIISNKYNSLRLRHSQHPSPPVKLSGLNVSKSPATQADKHHGSDVQ